MEQLLNQILSELKELKQNQSLMQSQITENTQILKALEHNSEVHKAEMDNLNHNVAELCGDIKSIKSAVVKGEKAYNFLENFNKFSVDK